MCVCAMKMGAEVEVLDAKSRPVARPLRVSRWLDSRVVDSRCRTGRSLAASDRCSPSLVRR